VRLFNLAACPALVFLLWPLAFARCRMSAWPERRSQKQEQKCRVGIPSHFMTGCLAHSLDIAKSIGCPLLTNLIPANLGLGIVDRLRTKTKNPLPRRECAGSHVGPVVRHSRLRNVKASARTCWQIIRRSPEFLFCNTDLRLLRSHHRDSNITLVRSSITVGDPCNRRH